MELTQGESGSFYLFCFSSEKLGLIFTLLFVLFNTTVVTIASSKLITNRNKFPIMERSPLLSVVAIQFANFQVSGQACMALFQQKESDLREIHLIDDIGLLVFSLTMIARIIRINYAFNRKNISSDSKLKNKIYGSQSTMAIFSIVLSICLATIPYYIEKKKYENLRSQSLFYVTYKISVLSITTILILLYGRHLKIISVNFNLGKESLLLGLQLVLLINVKFWIYYTHMKDVDVSHCITENIDQVLNSVFLYTLIINIAFIPLLHKKKYHEILPPSLILDEFSIFIANNQNVVVFYNYVKRLDSVEFSYLSEIPENLAENLKLILHRMNYESKYFHRNMLIFYLDYYGKNQEEKEANFNMEVLESLFPIADLRDQIDLRQTFSFNANINLGQSTVLEEPQKKPQDNSKLIKLIYDKYLIQVKSYLDNIYKEHFQKTVSFSVIRNQFQLNEQIALNLFHLNMTKLNESLLQSQGIRKIKFYSIVSEDEVTI